MTCKHAKSRRGYTANIPRKTDYQILAGTKWRSIERGVLNLHLMHIWRQYHAAEARKRGLS